MDPTYRMPAASYGELVFDIFTVLHDSLTTMDPLQVDRILALRDEGAQEVLNHMQKKLDATSPYRAQTQEGDISTYRSRIRVLMTKLALASGRLPSALFLQGVRCISADPVGQGSFSDIFQGEYQGKAIALKRLRIFHLVNDAKDALFRESILWRNLEHRHVLPFIGIESTIFSNSFCMVLPWTDHGNVIHYTQGLRENGHSLDALLLLVNKWFKQIAYGLAYLHSEEIVHGDLRGANVLIDDNWEVKLADFGLSILAKGGGNSSSLRGGNARWLAPELMIPEQYNLVTTRPTYASDLYSLACLSIELYTGYPPFFDLSEAQTILSVIGGNRPERPHFFGAELMPLPLWNLVTECWDSEPSMRPSADRVVKRLMLAPSQSMNPPLPVRHTTMDQCLFPDCPKFSSKRSGTAEYCSPLHKEMGLYRSGCLYCRRQLAIDDDLCPWCQKELERSAPTLLVVPHDHAFYGSVSNLFRDTWGRNVKGCPTVKYVYKIVSNSAVLHRYRAYCTSVEQRGQFVKAGKRAGNETEGWHGTRRACQLGNDGHTTFCASPTCSLCGIIRTSYDVAYGASGLGFGLGWEILGMGIYTSSSSSKSDKYSYNELWNTPLKAILLNKVVMGKCFAVDKPEGTLNGPPPGYDSTRLSQAATADDIAVYHNDAIRPTYLVMYDYSTYLGGSYSMISVDQSIG